MFAKNGVMFLSVSLTPQFTLKLVFSTNWLSPVLSVAEYVRLGAILAMFLFAYVNQDLTVKGRLFKWIS